MNPSLRPTILLRLMVITTSLSLISACVGYIQLGSNSTAMPVADASADVGRCDDIFYLPTLETPGLLPSLETIQHDDELVEHLSHEILRLREVIRQNTQDVRTEYLRYLASCS